MSVSVNKVFENYQENVKQDHNWLPVTQTLEKFVSQIRCFLGDTVISDEQEVYIYLVVLEDFDAYYDGRYASIIDTWIADIWQTKSCYWQEIFIKAWTEELAFQNNEQQYFRPSKLFLDKHWMKKNNMEDVIIMPIKSLTFNN